MILKHVIVGLLRTNCYLGCDEQTKTCAVIDPGAKAASTSGEGRLAPA